MDSVQIKDAMKKAHDELTTLESKLADADEGKKAVIAEMIEGKTTEWDSLKADLAHAEKREQIEKEIADMEAKRNETEGKTEQLQDVKVEAKSQHNEVREEVQHTNFFNEYVTYGGKVSDYLNKTANEKGVNYIESKMAEGGAKMPEWMAKTVLPKPVGHELEDAMKAAAYEGKAAVLVSNASGTASGGGSLVEEMFEPTLFKVPKRQSNIADKCFVKRGVGKEVQFPKLTQSTDEYGVSVSWGTEGGTITQDDPVFSRIDVNLARLTALSQASMREIRENQVGLEAEMLWMYQGAIAREIDACILNGTAAASNAPQGINTNAGTTAGVVSVARETASQVSYTDLVNMQFAVDDGVFGAGMYVLSAGSTGAMKYVAALDDSNGRPIFGGDSQSGWGVGQGNVPTIAGQPYVSTVSNKRDGTVIALGQTGDVMYGNFLGYGLAYDSQAGVVIERSDEYAFNKGLVTYRAILYVGGKILGGEMFSVLDDASGASSSSSSSSS